MKSYFELSNEQSKRFNILKILFAIFVVFFHSNLSGKITFADGVMTYEIPQWIKTICFTFSEAICGCANGGFFIIASILLYRKEFRWKDNMKKKIKSLIIPYIFGNLFVIFIYWIFQNISITKSFFGNSYNDINNFNFLRWIYVFGIGCQYPANVPLWFVRNLLVLNVLSLVVKKCIDHFPKVSFIVLLINALFIKFDFYYLIYPVYLFYWCLGYYIVKYRININVFDNKKLHVVIIYVLMILLMGTKYYFDIKEIETIKNIRTILTTLISLIFYYSVFSKNISSRLNTFMLKISKYNFGIFLFHNIAIGFEHKLFIKLLPISNISLLIDYFIPPIITIVLIIVGLKILNIIMPKTLSIITGSRIN